MAKLRDVSARPELVVGAPNQPRLEALDKSQIGIPGPVWRERVLYALPLNASGPVQIANVSAVQGDSALVADPDGNVIAPPNGAVYVHRMLYARWTENTRI